VAIYYDASEKGTERRGKQWREEGEKLMAGNKAFAHWKMWNTCIFGVMAGLGIVLFFGFFTTVAMRDLPPDDEWAVRLLAFGLGGWIWSIGRGRYTRRCRKIALSAELEKQAAQQKR
jgi:predicted MFS family arabinose efflux permease